MVLKQLNVTIIVEKREPKVIRSSSERAPVFLKFLTQR